MPHKKQGFTLIEIAIVLTIIGLIIGGIFTGKSILRQAQVQSVITDLDRYKKAIQLFKEKYLYLPGDLPTATSFWGTDTSCPITPANVIPKTATCNGNGDGRIGVSTSNSIGTLYNNVGTTDGLESLRVWQHLANAGFIDGSYTGAFSSRAGMEDPGMNTPLSKVSGGTFLFFYILPPSNMVDAFPANYNHVFMYGESPGTDLGGTAWLNTPLYPVLTAAEAAGIDQKLDDGKPGTGNVLSPTSDEVTLLTPLPCATGNTTAATYNVGVSGNVCVLIFITGF